MRNGVLPPVAASGTATCRPASACDLNSPYASLTVVLDVAYMPRVHKRPGLVEGPLIVVRLEIPGLDGDEIFSVDYPSTKTLRFGRSRTRTV